MIPMLGDENLNGPGGFLILYEDFEVPAVDGRRTTEGMYVQLRLLVPAAAQRDGQQRMGRPRTYRRRASSSADVEGRASTATTCTSGTGRSARLTKSIDLGEKGHDPARSPLPSQPEPARHGFVGAALSSVMWHFFKDGRRLEGREGNRGRGPVKSRAGTSRCLV